ncbi:two-component system, OmpR family, sensor histidine kinase MtrB [Actinobaculum suis]|uniref:Sensor histidine kinase MtrB n=2 Tax=Actinobaculum suis TaxID=1657 RepID=A0A1G7B177_9ACTO|nr:MtrAB system histidine kinase MtrB [Actinobaculum suis]SDE20006.1 two-component system, OmpR family, sensor histidine kinase MtrB [Actinobaculum suis]
MIRVFTDSGVYSGFGSRVRRILLELAEHWRGSMIARVVVTVLLVGGLTAALTGAAVANQTRDRLYSGAVKSSTEQFESTRAQAQSTFDAQSAPTSGQLQQIATALVRSQYDAQIGVVGAALLRTPGQTTGTYEVAEVATQAPAIGELISKEMRTSVPKGDGVYYQPVAIPKPGEKGESSPGIVVGAPVRLPNAGNYEFYILYSLQNQEDTARMVTRILTTATVVMLLIVLISCVVVVRFVLRPVREASQNARRVAAGVFDVRMPEEGEDEIAQLGRSFNQMAESIDDQFTRLERLSRVQQNFVSAVSHELRTPVTTIRMAGQLIYDKRHELPDSLRRTAELQHDQLINLDTMLSDLLEISRYDAGGMKLSATRANLTEIARKVVESQVPLAIDNGVRVQIVEEGDPHAKVDARRIERIIRNLVVNAIEHAEGGPVRVRVAGGPTAVAVEVSDRGIGLSKEQASHVFDRFWRADTSRVRKSGGTGLGLTIAREDALLHNGRLQAIGEPGVGSTFLLTVPREQHASWAPVLELQVAAAEPWPAPAGEIYGAPLPEPAPAPQAPASAPQAPASAPQAPASVLLLEALPPEGMAPEQAAPGGVAPKQAAPEAGRQDAVRGPAPDRREEE